MGICTRYVQIQTPLSNVDVRLPNTGLSFGPALFTRIPKLANGRLSGLIHRMKVLWVQAPRLRPQPKPINQVVRRRQR